MVVHDEETLSEALLLLDSGPVRYSDEYVYTVFSNRDAFESRVLSAFTRGSIAIVVPLGKETEMEVHATALLRVKDRRKREELKAIREYFREHPERVQKIEAHARKQKREE